mgnify:CR=1 FL=1
MPIKKKSAKKVKVKDTTSGTYLLVNGKVIEKGFKTEKTKRQVVKEVERTI